MVSGGDKYSTYIAIRLLPHLPNYYPLDTLTYLVFFYGASNVKKYDQIVSDNYSLIYVLCGDENFVLLIFSNVAIISDVKTPTRRKKRIYQVSGSLSFHGPFSQFFNQ